MLSLASEASRRRAAGTMGLMSDPEDYSNGKRGKKSSAFISIMGVRVNKVQLMAMGVMAVTFIAFLYIALFAHDPLDYVPHKKVHKYLKKKLKDMHVRTNPKDQPIVIQVDNFFQEDKLKNLTQCLSGHPLMSGNHLTETNFKRTRGFMLRWNKDGLEQFRSMEVLKCLVPYFDAVVLPEANAWVMNLLICDKYDYKKGEPAVGLHLDQSIAIKSRRNHLAHEVDVFYVSIPREMEGGELEVWSYDRKKEIKSIEYKNPTQGGSEPDVRVKPETNMLIKFRGDAYHQVMGYKAPHGGPRVSLVIEQYVKNVYDYQFTKRFKIETND